MDEITAFFYLPARGVTSSIVNRLLTKNKIYVG